MANELNKSEKAKGLLAKIAGLFAAQETTVEHKLADGTVLKADKFEVGGKIEGITAVGEFTLENGTKIVYDIAGVITEVTPPAPAVFKDYKLADGTTISADKLEAGGKVTIAAAPAPAGTYMLEDGSSIVVDADGVITSVTAKVVPDAMPDMTTPAGMLAAYNQFATGTIDMTGISTVLKALMEYSFGWQLREAQEKVSRDAALKVYTDNLANAQASVVVANQKVDAQGTLLKEMFSLMQEVLGAPAAEVPGASGRKKFSFADTDGRKKSFGKFQEAAKMMQEQWKEMEKAS